MRMISQALQGVSRTQLADAWHAARATSAAVVAWSRAVVPPVHLPQRQRQQQQQHQHMPGDRSARNRDDESLDEGTFQWAVRPKSDDLPLLATFYTDGSAYDSYSRRMCRCGWSFVAVDAEANVIAAAHGVPPKWVDSIPGAEAWALIQAANVACPGSVYKSDCLSVLKAVRAGPTKSTAHDRPLARVMGRLLATFDGDDEAATLVWLPGHSTSADVGRAALSDGTLLTATDHAMNARADGLANAAARAVLVDPTVRVAHVARFVSPNLLPVALAE